MDRLSHRLESGCSWYPRCTAFALGVLPPEGRLTITGAAESVRLPCAGGVGFGAAVGGRRVRRRTRGREGVNERCCIFDCSRGGTFHEAAEAGGYASKKNVGWTSGASGTLVERTGKQRDRGGTSQHRVVYVVKESQPRS